MSGKVYIEGGMIFWIWKEEILTQIPLAEILIIGELTLETLEDDYFIIFILRDGSIKRISMYANNFENFEKQIYQELNFEFRTQLASSTTWNSAIMYPTNLKGIQIFSIPNSFDFTEEVKNLISASR